MKVFRALSTHTAFKRDTSDCRLRPLLGAAVHASAGATRAWVADAARAAETRSRSRSL
jgi:hypothetical protein